MLVVQCFFETKKKERKKEKVYARDAVSSDVNFPKEQLAALPLFQQCVVAAQAHGSTRYTESSGVAAAPVRTHARTSHTPTRTRLPFLVHSER